MRIGIPALTVLLTALAVPAGAQVRLFVADMDPSASATLGHWEQFSLRIEYETDRPIRIRGDAMLDGRRVTSINSGSPQYDAGEGEALFWFAYTDAARVDAIVVRAVDEDSGEVLAETERPVRLEWTGRAAARRKPAAWVERLQAQHAARMRRQIQVSAGEESPAATLFFMAMTWSVPVYIVLQLVALWRMRGGWRVAAAVPAVPMGLVLVYTLLAMLAGSNLFPLMLLFASPPAAVYLIGLLGAHAIAKAR